MTWGQQDFEPPTVFVAGKKVTVCPIAGLNECLAQLPADARVQLPDNLFSQMGYRSAVVYPLVHPQLAGLVLWAPEREHFYQTALVGTQLLTLELREQLWLTFWHEIGHLEVRALQGDVLPKQLSVREQEWLADAFLYWHIAKEHRTLQLAWQQFHRRNLQVINDVSHLSHWSSLYLLPLLQRYSVGELVLYADFSGFCQDIYPSLRSWSDTEMVEVSRLLQYLFGSSTTPNLPEFLYWRRPEIAPVITPTLEQLMGPVSAGDWLSRQHLLIKS
ncbi:hypothetical protein [Shewanella sp.]|uniref:hypothetical protein n=1 Tax=Shewanella sp. TaxID=50422 RepID=UPI003562F2C6